jgi:putative transposase
VSAARRERGDVLSLKTKYGGLEENEARRLKALEEENGRLKKIVAQQALDLDALKAVLSKKW